MENMKKKLQVTKMLEPTYEFHQNSFRGDEYGDFMKNLYKDKGYNNEIIITKLGEYGIVNPHVYYLFCSQMDVKGSFYKYEYDSVGRLYIGKPSSTIIDKKMCWDFYTKGYDKGVRYFNEKYNVTPDLLFDEDKAIFFERSLHSICYHGTYSEVKYLEDRSNKQIPWNAITFLEFCKVKSLETVGYYSALLVCVENLRKDYKLLFSLFDKCVHDEKWQKCFEKKPTAPTTKTNSGGGEGKYNSFSQLFTKVEYEANDLQFLKGNQIINDLGKWIGHKKQKGAIVAWIEVLESRGHIEKIDRKILVPLLETYFDFTISESIFEKATTTRNNYHADFLILIK